MPVCFTTIHVASIFIWDIILNNHMKKSTRIYVLILILASLFLYALLIGRIYPKFAPLEKRIDNMTARELHAKGLKLHSEKKYGAAIDVWQKELQLNADIPNTTNNIGIEYAALGAFNTAKQYNLEAVNLDPGFAHAYYSLSRVNFKLTEYEKAADNASKAIELGYVNADVYYTLAGAQAHLNSHEKAIEAYKKTLSHNTQYPMAHFSLGLSYRATKKFEQAEAEFKQELSVNPETKPIVELALADTQAESAAGDKDKLFKAAIAYRKYEDNVEVYRKEEAVLQEIITIDPRYPQAHYQLGRLYEKWD